MRPFLLIIDGSIGVGKTTAAKVIHQRFPRTVFLGLDHTKWFISHFKRDRRNNKIVNEVILVMAREFLLHNINVIVEQAFTNELVEQYQRLGRQCRARVVTIQLTAERSILLSRITVRSKISDPLKRPSLTKSFILRNVRAHAVKPSIGAQVVNTTHLSPLQVVEKIVGCMKKRSRTDH